MSGICRFYSTIESHAPDSERDLFSFAVGFSLFAFFALLFFVFFLVQSFLMFSFKRFLRRLSLLFSHSRLFFTLFRGSSFPLAQGRRGLGNRRCDL